MLDLLTQIGGCVLYHDYRSGSFRDWSGAGNDGTPTLAGLTRGGADFHSQAQLVTVPYASGLDLGGGSAMTAVVLFAEKYGNNATNGRRPFEQSGGFFTYFDGETNIDFFIAGNSAGVAGIQSTIRTTKCFAIDWTAGAAPNLYCDGVFKNVFSATIAATSDTSSIVIGNRAAADRCVGQTMSAICFFNKALSATEHAQVYAALRAMKWPTKATGRGTNRIGVASDCVAGYNMRPVAGKVFDMSGNGNNGTIVKAISSSEGLEFNGVNSYVSLGNPTDLQFTGAFTLSAWVRTGTKATRIFSKDDGTNRCYLLRIDTATGRPELTIFRSNAAYTIEATSLVADNNIWHQIVGVNDGTDLKIYVDGGIAGTSAGVGGAVDNDTVNMEIGRYNFGGGSEYFNGTIKNAQIFNVAKDAAWVMSEYQKGARQVTFKTDFGARETIAAVGAPGPLTNTPWEVVSGTHEIITTTINGTPVKAIRCVTAGAVAIPASLFRVGQSGAARGGFKFWMYRATLANLAHFGFIGSQKSAPATAGFNGYRITSTGSQFFLAKMINGGSSTSQVSALGACVHGVWYEYEITVGDGGVFTTYLNGSLVNLTGGSGTNPTTDATYTTSKFLVADLDAGDMLALGSVDGEYALEKQLGVSNAR